MSQKRSFALVEYKMLDAAGQKNEDRVQQPEEVQNLIRSNSFKGAIQFPDNFLATNASKLQMQLNTHYITQICCPRRFRASLAHVRMRPYYIPQRSRTKSENSDTSSLMYLETMRTVDAIQSSQNTTLMETNDPSTSQMDTSGSQPMSKSGKCNSLVKSKSLEDLVRAIKSVDGSQPSHEMEFVSSRIQKLRVQE